MTRRNADAGNEEQRTDSRTRAGREERAVQEARAERESNLGEEMNQDDLPGLPRNEDLQTANDVVDNFQALGQRKDGIEDMTRGTSDVPISGEQYVGAGGGELDGTNAVTAKTRAALADNEGTFTVHTGMPVRNMTDVGALIYEAVGTRNTKPGKMYTAIKSTNFKFPGGRGNRAAILQPNGDITYLSNGTTYSQWYAQLSRGGGLGLIFRFDQHLEAKNPFTVCDVYEMKNLPAVAVEDDLSF